MPDTSRITSHEVRHKDDNEEEYTKQLDDELPVFRDRIVVLKQFALARLNMRERFIHIVVDVRDRLSLLMHECGHFCKHGSHFRNLTLDLGHAMHSRASHLRH